MRCEPTRRFFKIANNANASSACARKRSTGWRLLAVFHPYLTGSVLDGTAGRFSMIDILLYPDSDKDVEIFLLNQGIAYEHMRPAQ